MVLAPLPLRSPAMLSSRLAQRLLSSLSDDALVDSSWWPVSLVPLLIPSPSRGAECRLCYHVEIDGAQCVW